MRAPNKIAAEHLGHKKHEFSLLKIPFPAEPLALFPLLTRRNIANHLSPSYPGSNSYTSTMSRISKPNSITRFALLHLRQFKEKAAFSLSVNRFGIARALWQPSMTPH